MGTSPDENVLAGILVDAMKSVLTENHLAVYLLGIDVIMITEDIFF